MPRQIVRSGGHLNPVLIRVVSETFRGYTVIMIILFTSGKSSDCALPPPKGKNTGRVVTRPYTFVAPEHNVKYSHVRARMYIFRFRTECIYFHGLRTVTGTPAKGFAWTKPSAYICTGSTDFCFFFFFLTRIIVYAMLYIRVTMTAGGPKLSVLVLRPKPYYIVLLCRYVSRVLRANTGRFYRFAKIIPNDRNRRFFISIRPTNIHFNPSDRRYEHALFGVKTIIDGSYVKMINDCRDVNVTKTII